MKRILFNATHVEELRVAIVDGQKLLDLDLESAVRMQRKGNIYKAIVTRVEPSLEACFINYGQDRHGFLPFKEIYRGYFKNYSSKTPLSKVNIKDVIKEGQELIVQVEKDERSNKGAALTTFISLAGRFLVLMPNNPKGGGISRRVEGKERADLKRTLDTLKMPKQHAMIARTAALGRTEEELKWDYEFLIQLWTAIEDASANSKAPTLIYQESNLLVRAIRDHLNSSVQELIIDDKEIFERASRFVSQVMPGSLSKLKRHDDTTPLFSRFQIESQIESAFSREVQLPSGGAIVIDHTEALISIDVNSARATKGSDIEDTALNTNLEAVDEIARQLRIRDLGGLLVLDLIDMSANQNQRKVESRLKAALAHDRARVQVGRISRFGLLEMSRQRIRASIDDANYHTCPRCDGTGHIRSIVSGSLSLLRIIEEEALKENTESLQVFLPIDTAAYLLNEKRRELTQLESRLATRVVVVPNSDMQSPHYEIKRLRSNDLDENPSKASHELSLDIDKLEQFKDITGRKPKAEKPVIGFDQMTPATPPPTAKSPASTANKPKPATKPSSDPSEKGLIKRLWKTIKGEAVEAVGETQAEEVNGNVKLSEPEKSQEQETKRTPNRNPNNRRLNNRNRNRNSRNRNNPNNRNRHGGANRQGNNSQNKQGQGQGQNQNQNQNQANPNKGQENKPAEAKNTNPNNKQATSQNSPKTTRAKNSQPRTKPGVNKADVNKPVANKPAETKPAVNKPVANKKESDVTKKPVKQTKAAAPTSTTGDKKVPARQAKPKEATAAKKAPVRKKRASKKKVAAKKTSDGNTKSAGKAAPAEVDGNK